MMKQLLLLLSVLLGLVDDVFAVLKGNEFIEFGEFRVLDKEGKSKKAKGHKKAYSLEE